MESITRREILTAAAAITGGAMLLGNSAIAQSSPVKPVKYEAKPLPFDPSALKGISEKLIVSHHDKNYDRIHPRRERVSSMQFFGNLMVRLGKL